MYYNSLKQFLAIVTIVTFSSISIQGKEPSVEQKKREVWIAIRNDGTSGDGSFNNPFDGSSADKLDQLFDRFFNVYGDNLVINFGAGTFWGTKNWQPRNNWHIRGVGIDNTILKTLPNPNSIGTVGFRPRLSSYGGEGLRNFMLSDMTFDFNIQKLRKANRVFVYYRYKKPVVSYCYVANIPEWKPNVDYYNTNFRRAGKNIAKYKGKEYIAVKKCKNKTPEDNTLWSKLQSNSYKGLESWKEVEKYSKNAMVIYLKKGYICLKNDNADKPNETQGSWVQFQENIPDPRIYTNAAFIPSAPPMGGHRVQRVKAINGQGSAIFDREDFIIGLGGDNCVIEDCIIDDFKGDYSTVMVVFFGSGSVIRNCTAYGNGRFGNMAYGDACNFEKATNIDSLTNNNVTFRNNVFVQCHRVGILVNVNGNTHKSLEKYRMSYGDKKIPFATNSMDGLFIYNNLIQMKVDAPYGAIQVQSGAAKNIVIKNNCLRTEHGNRARAIGILKAENVLVSNNICEANMYSEIISKSAILKNNQNFNGQEMKVRK